MSNEDITVYGAHWCPDCRRSKQFLGEHQIPYNWVDIEEDKNGEKTVIEKNNGKRIIPTIVFLDGSFLVEPSNAELAAKLGLKTKASRSHYDLIVLGGGPAGLTSALYTARTQHNSSSSVARCMVSSSRRADVSSSSTCAGYSRPKTWYGA